MRLVLTLTIILAFAILETTVTVQGQLVSNETNTTGIISGFADIYPDNSKAVLQVKDKDMITNPGEIDHLQVHIWSYTDANGIRITLSETAPGSGVFNGTVYFSTVSLSGRNTLQVSLGDKVFAEYIDPVSNIGTPEPLDMFTRIIGISQPPSPPLDLVPTPSSTGITLTWNLPSNDGGSTIIGYKIERNDGSGYQTIISNTNSFTTIYSDTGVVAGLSYTYRVSAINSAGTSSPSNEVSITINITSRQPPSPVIFSPKSGNTIIIQSAPVSVTITGASVSSAIVNVFDGSTLVGTTTASKSGAWQLQSTLSTGTHILTARATNLNGTSPASFPISFNIVIPMSPTITSPSNGPTVNTGTPTITGTSQPNVGIKVFDGPNLIGSTVADNSGLWSLTPSTPLSDGFHSLTAQSIEDDVSSGFSGSVNFTVSTPNLLPYLIPPAVIGTAIPALMFLPKPLPHFKIPIHASLTIRPDVSVEIVRR